MLTKIKDGFFLGIGFGIALLLIYTIYMFFIFPIEMEKTLEQLNKSSFSYSQKEIDDLNIQLSKHDEPPPEPEVQFKLDHFHELSIDEKIDVAGAIAIGSYQQAEDGLQRAIISEFLKKEPDIELYYEVGDEIQFMSSYPSDHGFDKSEHNFIVFFTGKPPSIKSGMTYQGERISGLNDIPIKLLREKCNSSVS